MIDMIIKYTIDMAMNYHSNSHQVYCKRNIIIEKLY